MSTNTESPVSSSKYIVVEFSDRSRWTFPASIVASDRANYYVGRDVDRGDLDADEAGKALENEIEFAMSDDFELRDWLSNNMNWEDVAPHAKRVPYQKEEINYEREWGEVHTEIVVGNPITT